jgi:predicted nucleic acid-binding protein
MMAEYSGSEYVVDTSVALKWFVETEDADVRQARQLREAFLRGQCILRAPEFLLLELANALTTGRRSRPNKVLEALEAIRQLEVELETLRSSTLERAVAIASSCDVRVYDSYFLALAVDTGSILVTADETFLRKASAHPSLVLLRQLRLSD